MGPAVSGWNGSLEARLNFYRVEQGCRVERVRPRPGLLSVGPGRITRTGGRKVQPCRRWGEGAGRAAGRQVQDAGDGGGRAQEMAGRRTQATAGTVYSDTAGSGDGGLQGDGELRQASGGN